MKLTNLTSLLLVFLTFLSRAGATGAADITVSLDKVPEQGTVELMLFSSADSFIDFRAPAVTMSYPPDQDNLYRVQNIPPGEYALVVFNDANNNRLLDKSFIGIPKEPIGFSNRYDPRGPPSYQRAAFELTQNETRQFDVKLRRPLGNSGRLGVGVGAIVRSSPYRDYSGNVSRIIPALIYRGENVQIFGPNILVSLAGTGKLRLAATGRLRIGVYEEGDSPFLKGMGDREDTFMAGLALKSELAHGFGLSISLEGDLLNRIGGSELSLQLDKSIQLGDFRITPQIGFNRLSAALANHDFGVPAANATSMRPLYRLDDSFSLEGGVGMLVEISRGWLIIANLGIEYFDQSIKDSPIVDQDYVVKGFAAINYVF
jgi:outer membrane protein